MYKDLRELLADSEGLSQFVIALVIDIRGFTPFCQTVDSAEVALFIKKVYMKIMDDYFPEFEFYKPVGDGLLIVIPYDEEELKEICNEVVAKSMKLLEDFKTICENEPMINFAVPRYIGIGIARGSACCLKSGDLIVDYSGKVLNLASRLMDIARPSGIVIDHNFNLDLLEEKIKSRFTSEEVYVRGIAENDPITVHFIRDYTAISDMNRKPFQGIVWKTVSQNWKLRLIDPTAALTIKLEDKPFDFDEVKVRITTPAIRNGQVIEGLTDVFSALASVYKINEYGGITEVQIDADALKKKLMSEGIPEETEIRIEVVYPVIARSRE